MKKFLFALVTLIALGCTITALAEECKYAGQGDPCEIKWWVDTEKKQHCRACFYHVEDKEDMNSHVPITAWTDCTVDESTGKCSGCGYSYQSSGSSGSEEQDQEAYLLEYFMVMSMEAGTAPVEADVSGSTLEIGFSKYFRNTMMELGYLTSESLAAPSEYTLTLPGGTEYAYEGAPVEPVIKVERSDYGSGVWLENMEILSVASPAYANNDTPGTATVSVDFVVQNGNTYTISKSFTITGEAATERLPGDADGNEGVNIADAVALLRHLANNSASIHEANADVNGDGIADLKDLLCLLQYAAGWDVTLK